MPAKVVSAKDKAIEEQMKSEAEKAAEQMSEYWDKIDPVVRSILKLENVSQENWSYVVNLMFEKKALFNKHYLVYKKHLEEAVFKPFLSVLASEMEKLSPERQVEFFGNCWGKWFRSSILMGKIHQYLQRYATSFNIEISMRSLWKTHMFSKECKDTLVQVSCDIIDEYRHGNPSNLDLVPKLISSLTNMDDDSSADTSTTATAAAPQPAKPQRGVRVVHYVSSSYGYGSYGQTQTRQTKPKQSETKKINDELKADILAHTSKFYTEESGHIEEKSPADAIKYVKGICDKEHNLCKDYLTTVDDSEIDKVLNAVLIVGHIPYFLKGFEGVVLAGDIELGSAIMELFRRAELIPDLAKHFFDIIKTHVLQLFEANVKEASIPEKFVELAITQYDTFHKYSITAFREYPVFSESCDKAFLDIINDNAVVSQNEVTKDVSEMSKRAAASKQIATYVNNFLSVQKERMSESDLERSERNAMVLYEFLLDKRVFNIQYRKNLATRLFSSAIVGIDVETGFLDKLKSKGFDDEFVKAGKMLNDFAIRDDITARFADYMKANGLPKCSVTPLVCCAAWPINIRPQAFQISKNMEAIFQGFRTFFSQTSKKKTVYLLHQYGKGEVAFYTQRGEYVLLGTEYQLVLLPMIGMKGVTLQHIMTESGLKIEEVKYQLAFLIRNKLILIKNGEGMEEADAKEPKTWLPQSEVTVNPKFGAKVRKIELKFTKADKEAARAASGEGSSSCSVSQEEARAIFEDYVWRSSCTMVQVMKARKTLANRDLFSESATKLQRYFPLNERIFKRACEKLISEGIVRRKSKTDLEYIM